MNLLDCFVTKVLCKPYQKFDKWWVDVEYECYGKIDYSYIMFESEEKALEVKEGFIFIA